jgi:hypothetical protein
MSFGRQGQTRAICVVQNMLNVYWPKRQIAAWLESRPVIANVEAKDQPRA